MNETGIMAIEEFQAAIDWQADHAAEAGAHCTARVIRALSKVREGDTELGRRMRDWKGLTLKDAMPLRVTGGLHHLALTGRDERLLPVYAGDITDQDVIDDIVCSLAEIHDAELSPWLDGPPQTNEAGRSASIMAGLLWLAHRVIPCFDLFELGASAGVNTMIDRYFFKLGETEAGPPDSPMRINPEWRGDGQPPPPPTEFRILSVRGCDIAPIDLGDPASALRLKSYVWPDAAARMERIDAAIALASEARPNVVQKDAGAFVKDCLAAEQAEGTTRAMFHSIMWQYMPAETQTAITDMFADAGSRATPERPLAWISLETNPATFRHELKVRRWTGRAGDGEPVFLAHAHPHGAWVEWVGGK
ncbi:MAG: DUF2332 domain-containing protein [Pseudomonadota bacterium]